MMLICHRLQDRKTAMRASNMPHVDVDKILSSSVPSEVLFVFTRLYDGDSDLLVSCHPSLIREAFEMAIKIMADADWFAKARNTIERLLTTTLHKNTLEGKGKQVVQDECEHWNHMFLFNNVRPRFLQRAYDSSSLYRAALLDFVAATTAEDNTGAVEYNTSLTTSNTR